LPHLPLSYVGQGRKGAKRRQGSQNFEQLPAFPALTTHLV
jgi:hypothetical protein